LPDTQTKQVTIVNYPDKDLDLLSVFRTNATAITSAMR
jgi:hypothetical protein